MACTITVPLLVLSHETFLTHKNVEGGELTAASQGDAETGKKEKKGSGLGFLTRKVEPSPFTAHFFSAFARRTSRWQTSRVRSQIFVSFFSPARPQVACERRRPACIPSDLTRPMHMRLCFFSFSSPLACSSACQIACRLVEMLSWTN